MNEAMECCRTITVRVREAWSLSTHILIVMALLSHNAFATEHDQARVIEIAENVEKLARAKELWPTSQTHSGPRVSTRRT
jgi:hypothetical protein